jgi:hypothetical protein
VLVALAVAASHAVLELSSARGQTDYLLARRGATVLDAIEQRLAERQRAKQVYAQLLADQSGVVANTAIADKIGLAQVLLPEKAKLDIERVAVYTADGNELLSLGPSTEAARMRPLVALGLAGITRTNVEVSDEGLTVLGGTPIKGPNGIVGALVVGRTLGPDDLRDVRERDGVELAVFRGGNLVSTTSDDPGIQQVLADASATTDSHA